MTARIRLEQVIFFENPAEDSRRHGCPGADGVAYYEVLVPCTCSPPCVIICPEHPHDHHHHERQPFSVSGQRYYEGATPQEIADNRANIWAWNGNREAPTLTPSFSGPPTNSKGQVVRPFNVHLFLTDGKINLCGDSTVTL